VNYFEIDAVNFSSLKYMGDSPLHYLDALENERKDTPSLLRGRAVHTAALEPELFAGRYAVYAGKRDARHKAYQEFLAAHPDEDGVLNEKEHREVLALAAAFRAKPVKVGGEKIPFADLLARGQSEQVITWKDPETGVLCKARLDHFSELGLWELKSTGSVHERRFGALAARMRYHVQCAFYSDGLLYAHGIRPPVKLIAGEVKRPHDVAVFPLGDDDLLAGRETYQAWLRRLVECRASGEWPGRYPDEQPLSLPVYVFEDDDQDDGTAVVLEEEAA